MQYVPVHLGKARPTVTQICSSSSSLVESAPTSTGEEESYILNRRHVYAARAAREPECVEVSVEDAGAVFCGLSVKKLDKECETCKGELTASLDIVVLSARLVEGKGKKKVRVNARQKPTTPSLPTQEIVLQKDATATLMVAYILVVREQIRERNKWTSKSASFVAKRCAPAYC